MDGSIRRFAYSEISKYFNDYKERGKPMARFCGKCGKRLDEDTQLCPNCDAEMVRSFKRNAASSRKKMAMFFLKFALLLLLLSGLTIITLGVMTHYGIIHMDILQKGDPLATSESMKKLPEERVMQSPTIQTEPAETETTPETSQPEETQIAEPEFPYVAFERTVDFDGPDGEMCEYAVISRYDENGNISWSFETKHYSLEQVPTISPLSSSNGRYCYCEDGVVICLDEETGKVLWKNPNFGGYGAHGCIGEDGTLYLSAYSGPYFFAIDSNGRTIHKIETFDEEFFWPYDIAKVGNQIAVTFEGGPEELWNDEKAENGFVFLVNLDDFSYQYSETKPKEDKPPSDAWKNNVMKSDVFHRLSELEDRSGGYVLNSQIFRDQIKSVTFLDTLENAPGNAWCISEEGVGSVMAWVIPNKDLYDLYIAGEGGVCAPENACGLFCGYTNMEEINFNGAFHTHNTTLMQYMFYGCHALKELDVSGFDTAKVTRMEAMFKGCKKLHSLDLQNFDTRQVVDMGNMFAQCEGLTYLNLSSFTFREGVNTAYMYENCPSEVNIVRKR